MEEEINNKILNFFADKPDGFRITVSELAEEISTVTPYKKYIVMPIVSKAIRNNSNLLVLDGSGGGIFKNKKAEKFSRVQHLKNLNEQSLLEHSIRESVLSMYNENSLNFFKF